MRLGRVLAAAVGAALFCSAALAAGGEDEAFGPQPPEPAGYKMGDYRSATPATLDGARVIDTREAETLWRDRSAVFIDTMPQDVRPAELPKGTIWRNRPREHLPGSVWLLNVGYGALAPDVAAYFRAGLAALSGGDVSKPLVFYCRADCWMSWNAGKRAMEWGYRDVIWYPDGTDGWQKAGLPLEPATPYERGHASQ